MPLSRTFLAARSGARSWKAPEGGRAVFEPEALFLGNGENALQVAVAQSKSKPNVQDVRNLWERRQGRGASPLLLVVTYRAPEGSLAIACGPAGERPPVTPSLMTGQLERIAAAALEEPNRHAAIRLLNVALPEAHSELPGIRNAGMFATHELRVGVPLRSDWTRAGEVAEPILDRRGKQLVEGLGFTVEPRGTSASLLRANETATAIAVFLEENETPETPSTRFNGLSPVSQAFAEADKDRLPYVMVTRGPEIRIYSTNPDVGVGRRGRSETFIGINLSLLPDDRASYLPLLFGSDALRGGGSFEQILEGSKNFSSDLGQRLRQRVYEEVIPTLAEAVASRYEFDESATDAELNFVYEASLVLLFRLLFVAYAEDKDVLPFQRNSMYQHRALKTLARELADRINAGSVEFDEEATDLWQQVKSLFNAVNEGNRDWGVPPYDGGLFSNVEAVNPSGYELDNIIPLTNSELGPVLSALLVDQGDDGVAGPVDFRSLSVREFGTIYEGLLESNLSMAAADLAVDRNLTYVPARKGDEIWVEKGTVYLHNRSGARKSSGSYFTKPFVVEHLLDNALTPALDEHLEGIAALLEAGSEADAAEAFFDFRCADIAMGSGHFLVAAVDRIEARLSSFLSTHSMPLVIRELDDLRKAAYEHLGELGEGMDIEHAALLRRLVGRRCIYGVDINQIAVELARLAIWIHTFVPGLPLSFLDHNLVQGNSLTGVGTIEEAEAILDPESSTGTVSVFHDQIMGWLDRAKSHLKRLATVAEATITEVKESRAEHLKAAEAVEPAKNLFDLLVAARLGEATLLVEVSDRKVLEHKDLDRANELVDEELYALHFPVVFPEVFLRDRPGFDCILGNPPWEKMKVEEHSFWSLRFPGLRSLPIGEQNRRVKELAGAHPDLAAEYEREVQQTDYLRAALVAGPYPGMGSGDPDLYKAFAWRFWALVRERGMIGVVLPRSAVAASGTAKWREEALSEGVFEDVTVLLNTSNWAFDDMDNRKSIALVGLRRGMVTGTTVRLRGPFASRLAFDEGRAIDALSFPAAELKTWTTGAAFPLLPTPDSGEVFLRLRRNPRFDDPAQPWRFRPLAELHATGDKGHMLLEPDSTKGLWPVFKGASFNLWEPDTGEYYAWTDPDYIQGVLQEKRISQHRHTRSAFHELDAEVIRDPGTLPCLQPRVAFRDIANRTNNRTVIVALVPPDVLVNHKAPYLLRVHGSLRDEAFVLAVLSSLPLDWYARRVVEITLSFDLLNGFPIPNPRESALRDRVVELAGMLAAPDKRFAHWAEGVGVPVGALAIGEGKDEAIAELDALVGLAYGLDASDLTHIFATFHPTWDHRPRLEAALSHFKAWKAKA